MANLDNDLSLRPRAGETAEDTLARVIAAAKNVNALEDNEDEDEDEDDEA